MRNLQDVSEHPVYTLEHLIPDGRDEIPTFALYHPLLPLDHLLYPLMDTEYLQQCPGPRHCIVGLSLTTAIFNARHYRLTRLRLATIHCSLQYCIHGQCNVIWYWGGRILAVSQIDNILPVSTVHCPLSRSPLHATLFILLHPLLTRSLASQPSVPRYHVFIPLDLPTTHNTQTQILATLPIH